MNRPPLEFLETVARGDVNDMRRRALARLVVRLAQREQWSGERLDQAMYVVDRQPAFCLLPDLHHFRDRIDMYGEDDGVIARRP
ncbi:hypothetical protein WS84_04200 [Burkholderia anthina]|uniref:hypothetical protein n=1 Tax=Burkholderia anthina TaxID=179879 RepID=UPI0007539BCF|nr:hypothetical protein [Burkholderia anthina]KVH02767.1 hypothetical protein WS84_04200 [Burkholderia anthina]KVM90649.1 hypothetical protein WT06_16685 [Burkholderia anthina]